MNDGLLGWWRKAKAVAVAAVLLAVWSSPAPGQAAVLTISEFGGTNYVAESGERNRLTLTPLLPGGVRYSDTGAVIRVSGGCRLLDPHTAECENSHVGPITLGDMDDTVTNVSVGALTLFGLNADGGPGNDTLAAGPTSSFNRLSGGPGDDTLTGNEGGEELIGGPGRDRLFGNDGDDVLMDGDTPGAPDDDTIEGGDGVDEVRYSAAWDEFRTMDRTAPVHIEMQPDGNDALAGEAGEQDVLRAVERFVGGAGDDRLRGNRAADTFDGGPGDDRLLGRGGDDMLIGGDGHDIVRGGRGNDEIVLGGRTRSRDIASCGDGRRDRVRALAIDDVPPRGCEYAASSDEFGSRLFLVGLRPIQRSGAVAFLMQCQAEVDDDGAPNRVRGTITLHEAGRGRLVGRRRFDGLVRRCHRGSIGDWVPIRLTALGRKLLSRRGGVPVKVKIRTGFSVVHWTVRLTARG